jgi:hypothetical protein
VEKNPIGYTKNSKHVDSMYILKKIIYDFFLSHPQYKEFGAENFTLLGYIIDYV